MLINPAYAQDASGVLGSLSQFGQLLPVALIMGVFYLLILRPQMRRQKEVRTMLAAIKRGDRVVTAGGLIGTVQKVHEKELEMDIAPSVRVTVLREMITSVV